MKIQHVFDRTITTTSRFLRLSEALEKKKPFALKMNQFLIIFLEFSTMGCGNVGDMRVTNAL